MKFEFNTVCPCGERLRGRIKKPTYFENSFSKVSCQSCGTRIFISCVRDKSERGARKFNTFIEILELGSKAEAAQKARLPVKAKIIAEKAGVDMSQRDSVIQTEMDNV